VWSEVSCVTSQKKKKKKLLYAITNDDICLNLYATPKCITLISNAEQAGITYLMSNDIHFEDKRNASH
jgi:hypothetical protein